MATPDAPQDDPDTDRQDDTTFATTASDTTEQLETTEATHAIDVEEQGTSRDLFTNPVDRAAGAQPAPAAAAQDDDDRAWPPTLPDRPSGPHGPAIVLGLVCLAVAGIVLAQELGRLTVDWGDVGPLGIVAAGAVLVLFGLLGLLSSRRRSTPS